MTIRFWVPAVVPKGRPRLARNGHAYTPKRTKKFEHEVGWLARKAGARPFLGPVHVTVTVVVTPPKDWNKTDREAAIGRWANDCVTDIDNVVKSVLDGMNGVAYVDDRQVCSLTSSKAWGLESGVRVLVSPLDYEDIVEVNSEGVQA